MNIVAGQLRAFRTPHRRADERFHALLVECFGARAGDARYWPDHKYPDDVREAATRFKLCCWYNDQLTAWNRGEMGPRTVTITIGKRLAGGLPVEEAAAIARKAQAAQAGAA